MPLYTYRPIPEHQYEATRPNELPQGISRLMNGYYRVRITRGKRRFEGGLHKHLANALLRHSQLMAIAGPRRRQRVSSGRKHRNIRETACGFQVGITRKGEHIYGGHFPTIEQALAARDNLESKYPIEP